MPGTALTPSEIIDVVSQMDTSLPNADVINLWGGEFPGGFPPKELADATSTASNGKAGSIGDSLPVKIGNLPEFESALNEANLANGGADDVTKLLNGELPGNGQPKEPIIPNSDNFVIYEVLYGLCNLCYMN